MEPSAPEDQSMAKSIVSESISINPSIGLDQIVKIDQASRSIDNPEPINPESDRNNRAEVQKMIDAGQLSSADDCRKAALIFQHGETVGDFSKAFELSLKSAELGMPPFATILAQSFDRLMVTLQQQKGLDASVIKQRFGTQYNNWQYYPLDDLRTEDDFKLFEPVIRGFKEKTADEQQAISQGLNGQWQNMGRDGRTTVLNKIKEDLEKVKQALAV